MIRIPFNKPHLTGNEYNYIQDAVSSGMISGDGIFTKRVHDFFENRYRFKKCFLTTSCTDALEMAAILLDIKSGDEVIMPSFTFVSTANAFVLRGAKVVFADCSADHPNMNADLIEELIRPNTKAIVVMHYAGIACDMEKIEALVLKHNLFLVEDAAHAIDSFYKDKPLGSFGHLATFSFHETKNIMAGEGGMLVINDEQFIKRAEIIREKGTNRSVFLRGEVDKYEWLDIGSSFLPSDIVAAFLLAQTEHLDTIQFKRKQIWQWYHDALMPLQKKGIVKLPYVPAYAVNNGHIYYLICSNIIQRQRLISYLDKKSIQAIFHYSPLHKSRYYITKHDGRPLPNCDLYADCLIRLPLFFDLNNEQVNYITQSIINFYEEEEA